MGAYLVGSNIKHKNGFRGIIHDFACHQWRTVRSEWRRACAEEQYWEPPALSNRRRRQSLSLHSAERRHPFLARKQKTYSQLQSPFFRLPEEIRSMIYAYLVLGKRFHIQQSYRRFGYVECLLRSDQDCHLPHECIKDQLDRTQREPKTTPWSRLVISHHQSQNLKYKPQSQDASSIAKCELLALAKTCRIA
jgi:hypothetical protein